MSTAHAFHDSPSTGYYTTSRYHGIAIVWAVCLVTVFAFGCCLLAIVNFILRRASRAASVTSGVPTQGRGLRGGGATPVQINLAVPLGAPDDNREAAVRSALDLLPLIQVREDTVLAAKQLLSEVGNVELVGAQWRLGARQGVTPQGFMVAGIRDELRVEPDLGQWGCQRQAAAGGAELEAGQRDEQEISIECVAEPCRARLQTISGTYGEPGVALELQQESTELVSVRIEQGLQPLGAEWGGWQPRAVAVRWSGLQQQQQPPPPPLGDESLDCREAAPSCVAQGQQALPGGADAAQSQVLGIHNAGCTNAPHRQAPHGELAVAVEAQDTSGEHLTEMPSGRPGSATPAGLVCQSMDSPRHEMCQEVGAEVMEVSRCEPPDVPVQTWQGTTGERPTFKPAVVRGRVQLDDSITRLSWTSSCGSSPGSHVGHVQPDQSWILEDCCPICLEPYWEACGNVVVLPCNHRLHYSCAYDWAMTKAPGKETCPLCNGAMFGNGARASKEKRAADLLEPGPLSIDG